MGKTAPEKESQRLLLNDESVVEVKRIVGVVPAKLIYLDASGVKRSVKVADIRQISPPLKDSLPELKS